MTTEQQPAQLAAEYLSLAANLQALATHGKHNPATHGHTCARVLELAVQAAMHAGHLDTLRDLYGATLLAESDNPNAAT